MPTTGSNWIFPLKVLLISTGVLSVAVLLKLSVPLILESAISAAPIFYSSVVSWLRPPYLYILINCIIISILASSKLHQNSDEDADSPPPQTVFPSPPVKVSADNYSVLDDAVSSDYGYVTSEPTIDRVFAEKLERVHAHAPPLVEARILKSPERETSVEPVSGGDFSSKEEQDSPPATFPRNDSVKFFSNYSEKENEKPPVSARFAHRKALKSSPEGKGLRVLTKAKRQDTLESTWRTITEGRAMPLTRHLKKSDTMEAHARRVPGQNDPEPGPMMKKSETFHERSSAAASPASATGKMRKEPSLSQDELNRRVEAFIRKFNEDMRLQRQESLNQYQEMVGRGGGAR